MDTIRMIADDQVRRSLNMTDAITAVEQVLRELSDGQAENFSRTSVSTGRGTFRFMGAFSRGLCLAGVLQGFWSSGYLGDKESAKASGLLSIYDTERGELRAILRTQSLNEMRVGAVTAIAVKHLSNPRPETVGLLGSGSQAKTQILAVCEVRKPERILVHSREKANREKFCEEMAGRVAAIVEPVSSLEPIIAESDIILEATDTNDAIIDTGALKDGCYISSIKTGRHGSRQIGDETIRRADLFVIDYREQAMVDGAGDVVVPIARGLLRWGDIVELGDIVTNRVPGRSKPSDVIVFKSCGMALNDLALARLVLDRTPT